MHYTNLACFIKVKMTSWIVPSQAAAYSTATNKPVMGQVSKEKSTAFQVEGKDVIETAIYRKEGSP